MGRTIHLTKADEAKFHLKIETESGTYEYDSIKSFAYKWCDTPVKGRIYNIDTKETARFHLRFKAIEVYYEYYSITEFLNDWQDFDEWLEDVEKENTKHATRVLGVGNTIKIAQYDKRGNYIRTWANAYQAQEELGINRGNINSCVNKRRKTAGGYIWEEICC